jgi:NAD dependent epimerase/dehydratase family enzyme
MKIILFGGNGFIGKTLQKRLLEKGHRIILISRKPIHITKNNVEEYNINQIEIWKKCFEEADAVINLAGEAIGSKRWTQVQKEKIVKSRIEITRAMFG